MTKQIITAETVRLAWKAGESVIVYAKGDIVTQQAQDDARHYGITLDDGNARRPVLRFGGARGGGCPAGPPGFGRSARQSGTCTRSHAGVDRDQLAAAAGSCRKRWSR